MLNISRLVVFASIFVSILSMFALLQCKYHPARQATQPTPTRAVMMALPDRAYAERQQLSPIRIHGLVKQVTCEDRQCRVSMHVESIERNHSTRILSKGDLITVLATSSTIPSSDPPLPIGHQAPLIGVPDNSVRIPSVSSHTNAWLRPAEGLPGASQAQIYELTAGPFGFGPSLEDTLHN